jgi:hypothetical protein
VLHHRRSNIDNASASVLSQHLFDCELRNEEKTFDVDGRERPQIVDRVVREGLREKYASVVDERIDRAKFGFRNLKASATGILGPEELIDARKSMSEDQYLQEFECSFEAAIQGAYFAPQMAMLREEKRIGPVPYDPSRPVNTFWDIGKCSASSLKSHQTTMWLTRLNCCP